MKIAVKKADKPAVKLKVVQVNDPKEFPATRIKLFSGGSLDALKEWALRRNAPELYAYHLKYSPVEQWIGAIHDVGPDKEFRG